MSDRHERDNGRWKCHQNETWLGRAEPGLAWLDRVDYGGVDTHTATALAARYEMKYQMDKYFEKIEEMTRYETEKLTEEEGGCGGLIDDDFLA